MPAGSRGRHVGVGGVFSKGMESEWECRFVDQSGIEMDICIYSGGLGVFFNLNEPVARPFFS